MSQKIVVLGAGISGVGACVLAKKNRADIFLSDYAKISEEDKKKLIELGVDFEEDGHTESKILEADLIIKSPGIPEKASIIQTIRKKNIPLISEIEYAFRYKGDAKIISITGSNGKTTTATLMYETLKNAHKNVALAGNIGFSFAEKVAEGKTDWFVLEVSSFQLDDCKDFKPEFSLILNITPDHLDRYPSFEDYAESKWKSAENQDERDYCIAWAEDEFTHQLSPKTQAQRMFFSTENNQSEAYITPNGFRIENWDFQKELCSLKGLHNLKNMMAVGLVAHILGLNEAQVKESFANFESVEHRLEKVAEINEVSYINDSKATNVDATQYALGAIDSGIIWLAGGVDKGNDYSLLEKYLQRIKALIAIGPYADKLEKAFKNKITIFHTVEDMEQAVRLAGQLAEEKDTVLLSPACASFDLFKNYEHRGKVFKEEVLKQKISNE
ncbi:MAG: UDP-N-acetylmuramoyl-L-alanine--D-glutamate ligase [Flavobacteriales bacterium]|jgi:UDP-N-acetylmuramoylalanine--D-glutamate ligase|nr:UDP-N-acetylmuramoyl-L-alanine--D-glutamate ligase [Flavobacteriales bacterium]